MSRTTLCSGCGLQVSVPPDYTRPRLRCPECGAFCEVPADRPEPRRQKPSKVDRGNASSPPAPQSLVPTGDWSDPAVRTLSHDPAKTVSQEPPSPVPFKDDIEDNFNRFFAEDVRAQAASQARAGKPVLQTASSGSTDAELAESSRKEAAAGRGAAASGHLRHTDEHQKLALFAEESYGVEPVEGEEIRCPNCSGSLPAGAVLCIHCGLDLRRGKQLSRTYTPIQRRWEPGLTLRQRLLLFTLLQLVGAPIFIWVAVRDWDVLGTVVAWVLYALLTSFLVGTYNHLDIERNTRGRVRLRRTWHICFFPLSPSTIPWYNYEGIVTRKARRVGPEDWLVVIAFAFLGLIPGLLWWYYAIEKDRYLVALAQNHGFPEEILYFGPQMSVMEDLADLITTTTNLPRLYV